MRKISACCMLVFVGTFGLLLTGEASAHKPSRKTTVYFLRHAEDMSALVDAGNNDGSVVPDCVPFSNNGKIEDCCLGVLNPLGEKRAQLLTGWFAKRGILPEITHIFSTHKARTLQTVLPIASEARLAGANLAADVDLNPGDGVQQVPASIEECDPGFEIGHTSFQMTVDALRALPPGSVAIVCGHSASLYPIMEAFGIDTTDPVDFPRDSRGRVNGLNNLWKVRIVGNQAGELQKHLVLDFELVRQKSE